MKLTFRYLLLTAAICLCGQVASAQSLKDLLKKATTNETVKSVVENVVENVTGAAIPVDITGVWTYSGTAVEFESEDLLKSAAASVAATQVENKLDEYVSKVGIKAGTFSFTFSEENKFTAKVLGKTFDGTYTLSEDYKSVSLQFGSVFGSKPFVAGVSVTGTQLDLLFKADRLLELLGKLTENSTNTILKTVGTVVNQYDGMKLGLELKK